MLAFFLAFVFALQLIAIPKSGQAQAVLPTASTGEVEFRGKCRERRRVDTLASGVVDAAVGPARWALLCGGSFDTLRSGRGTVEFLRTSPGTFWFTAELVNRPSRSQRQHSLSVALRPNVTMAQMAMVFVQCTRPQYGGRSHESGTLTLTVTFFDTERRAMSSACPVFATSKYSVGELR